jgi:hypothetical protein
MRRLDEIARAAAREIVQDAQAHGWDFRAPFSVSDTNRLADEILIWLQDHMEPAQAPEMESIR